MEEADIRPGMIPHEGSYRLYTCTVASAYVHSYE